MDQLRILGVAGSLRRASYSRGLIRAAKELAPSGMIIEVSDLADLPLFWTLRIDIRRAAA